MKPGVRCTVCTHPERVAIDRALIGMAGGVGSERTIANRFDLTKASIHRHRSSHLAGKVAIANRAARVESAKEGAAIQETTADTVRTLVGRALEYLDVSEVRSADGKLTRATDVKGAAATLRAALGALQLQAQLRGEIKTGGDVNVLVDQRGKPREEWAELTGLLFAALRPWPDAARAAAAALASAATEAPALVANRSAPDRTALDVVEGEIV